MESIGERLRAERKRLGFSLKAFGALGGVSEKTLVLYEKGERTPDVSFLANLSESGVDALFVVTGRADTSALSAEETDLVRRYREASDAVRAAAFGALIGGAAPAKVQQNFHRGVNIGQQVTGDVTGSSTFTFGSTKKKK